MRWLPAVLLALAVPVHAGSGAGLPEFETTLLEGKAAACGEGRRLRAVLDSSFRSPAHPALAERLRIDVDDSCLGADKDAVRRFFINTAGTGVARLRGWSPALADRLLASVDGARITLTCDDSRSPSHSPPQGLFRTGRHAVNLMGLHYLFAVRSILEDADDAALARARKSFKVSHEIVGEHRNIAFHEFLHLAGLDSVDAHNALEASGPLHAARQLDAVYSCAALAFPSPDAAVAPGAMMTLDACRTCVGEDAAGLLRCEAAYGASAAAPGAAR